MTTAVTDAFLAQAEASDKLGSPFTAGLCRLLADKLDLTTRFGHKILEWDGDPARDALPLRACGALHALARSWKEPDLKAAYPPAKFDAAKLWHRIADVLTRHDIYLSSFLDSPPQTNEVARSAIILGAALLTIARTRLPLALYEIGASAGLNLGFDAYRYNLGNGRAWGRTSAPFVISCDWQGELPPLSAHVNVLSRQGCDQRPLDPASEADTERLLAFIWPDQTQRLARTQAALELAAERGLKVEEADAGDWVTEQFRYPAAPGVCRFLYHTIVWQYLPAASRKRIEDALAAAVAKATSDTPIAHFSFEADSKGEGGALHLTVWPGGERHPVGRADFHGRWVEWFDVEI